mgnify:CR=1 FL=1
MVCVFPGRWLCSAASRATFMDKSSGVFINVLYGFNAFLLADRPTSAPLWGACAEGAGGNSGLARTRVLFLIPFNTYMRLAAIVPQVFPAESVGVNPNKRGRKPE